MMSILVEARERVLRDHSPSGYNIGINEGIAAGQAVLHLHVHLIPRYAGDSQQPRGGIRWVIPEKGELLDAADDLTFSSTGIASAVFPTAGAWHVRAGTADRQLSRPTLTPSGASRSIRATVT